MSKDNFGNEINKLFKEQDATYNEECLMVASIFASKNGDKFRQYLENWLKTPVVSPEENSSFAYFREGSKELIRVLFEMEKNASKA